MIHEATSFTLYGGIETDEYSVSKLNEPAVSETACLLPQSESLGRLALPIIH